MKLTPKEKQIVLHALRELISQFSGKEEWNPEDWPAERQYQARAKRLLAKLETER